MRPTNTCSRCCRPKARHHKFQRISQRRRVYCISVDWTPQHRKISENLHRMAAQKRIPPKKQVCWCTHGDPHGTHKTCKQMQRQKQHCVHSARDELASWVLVFRRETRTERRRASSVNAWTSAKDTGDGDCRACNNQGLIKKQRKNTTEARTTTNVTRGEHPY